MGEGAGSFFVNLFWLLVVSICNQNNGLFISHK